MESFRTLSSKRNVPVHRDGGRVVFHADSCKHGLDFADAGMVYENPRKVTFRPMWGPMWDGPMWDRPDVGRNNPVTKSSRIWLMWDRLMPARVDSQKVCETVHAQFAMGNVQSLSLELLIRHLFQRNHRPIPISSTQLTGSARLGIVL